MDESTKGLNTAFILDEWVPALRSGEYEQVQGTLRAKDNTMCCLGVACDLLVKKGILPDWELIYADREMFDADFIQNYTTDPEGDSVEVYAIPSAGLADGVTQVLPPKAADYIGVDTGRGPTLEDASGWFTDAVGANDQHLWSFAQIADALERVALKERGS